MQHRWWFPGTREELACLAARVCVFPNFGGAVTLGSVAAISLCLEDLLLAPHSTDDNRTAAGAVALQVAQASLVVRPNLLVSGTATAQAFCTH